MLPTEEAADKGWTCSLGVGRRLVSQGKITGKLLGIKVSDLGTLLNMDEHSDSPNGAEFLE